MQWPLNLPDLEPLTTYRLIAALGAVALLAAGFANPSDAGPVAVARYLTIAAMVALLALTYVSDWVRRHAGWGAYVVDTVLVGYLCTMVYTTNISADSLIASFVGVLICGLVLHRVVLVVAFMVTAAAIHIVTAFAVAAPLMEPMTMAVNVLLYTLFVGVMLCMQITARERRRNSESVMGAIFDQSSDALVYGYPNNGDMLRVNARARQLFETHDVAFIGRQIRAAFLSHHSEDELDGVLGQAMQDPSWGETCRFETATGRTFWGNMALRRLAAPYENLMMARITDMTAQMEREAALETAKEAAEAAAKARSQFLANMSHEIRTPMNGVIGMTSLLTKTDLDEDQQRYVDVVRASGESLLTIINEILDFSKIEAQQIRLEHQRFDLEEVVAEALHLVSPQASGKGLELALRMVPGQHRFFLGDAQRLRQVLVNLLSNAVKFTAHGDVTVTTNVVPVADGKAELHFQVIDTGIGIDAEVTDQLFEPFVQADASTTRKYGGTGLGLSISKSLVELMGGAMTVQSEPESGSTFGFHIEAESAPARPGLEGLQLEGLHAAVVQVHAGSGAAVAGTLHAVGMEVTKFRQPEELLEAYRSGAWQVILADLHSDSLEGVELAAALGARDDQRPPVILLAPLQSREVCDASLATVLRKPVRPSELLGTIEQVLGVAVAPDAAEARTAESRPDFCELSVLVAEDNLVNQQVVRQMLENLNVNAHIVADGREAVRAMADRMFDLVLMDMQMPHMDGVTATREIRALCGEGPYIAAMTASAMASDRTACLDAGMNDFIAKPVRVDDLERRLRAVMARRTDHDHTPN